MQCSLDFVKSLPLVRGLLKREMVAMERRLRGSLPARPPSLPQRRALPPRGSSAEAVLAALVEAARRDGDGGGEAVRGPVPAPRGRAQRGRRRGRRGRVRRRGRGRREEGREEGEEEREEGEEEEGRCGEKLVVFDLFSCSLDSLHSLDSLYSFKRCLRCVCSHQPDGEQRDKRRRRERKIPKALRFDQPKTLFDQPKTY